ncbi:N-acetyltransferase eco isoform X2 [Condylostylus longicornis]|uniref:N-acetyltransferase eco isoform X2 n=1 Tax=Condylostylus longicornis TaxID=2530218 RepID=UPI00244D9C2E|nr:N-acetyltransferase eco isoform X2 [Condylostylus longicornis]
MKRKSPFLDKNKCLTEVSEESLVRKSRLRVRSVNEKTPKGQLTPDYPNCSPNKFSESLKTPRTSRRKKCALSPFGIKESRRSLFEKDDTNENLETSFSGIAPLSPMSMQNSHKILRSSMKIPFVENSMNYVTSSAKKKRVQSRTTGNEGLQTIFNNVSIQSVNSSRLKTFDEKVIYSDKNIRDKHKLYFKHFPSSANDLNKLRRKETVSIKDLQISTKCFYTIQKVEQGPIEIKKASAPLNISPNVLKMVPKSPLAKPYCKFSKKTRSQKGNTENITKLANKGVSHGIRKNPSKNKQSIKSISEFLKTIKSEKLKCLPSKRVSPEKVKQVHNILKTAVNSIELARPLVINCENETFSTFSDSEESEIDDFQNQNTIQSNEGHGALCINTIKENELVSPLKGKKFFKSGHSSFKEIKITDNIKLGVSCGKMSLLSEKKKKTKSNKTFINEQAVVNDIIKNLDVSPKKKESEGCKAIAENFQVSYELTDFLNQQVASKMDENVSNISDILGQDNLYQKFREQIPYRTIDPNEIERQNLLLDFLITNNICNEKNFEIFIADPDNHKDEADEIINNIVEIVNEDICPLKENFSLDPYDHFRNQIPYNTTDPVKAKEQGILLDFLIENNICTEKNFTIFIKDLENRKEEAEKVIESVSSLMQIDPIPSENLSQDVEAQPIKQKDTSICEQQGLYPIFFSGKKYIPVQNKFSRSNKFGKLWRGAVGGEQYQIDAGQKEFGAKQCEKCGLVYTVHEPEEEKLHKEYHDSMYFLKFRGWIDEDVIGRYFEWSNDGRIIRVTSSEHQKKRERLMELLKIVDKELGFASYILPDTYVQF